MHDLQVLTECGPTFEDLYVIQHLKLHAELEVPTIRLHTLRYVVLLWSLPTPHRIYDC